MGMTEIRTAIKVDLKKPADQQPGLHVCVIALNQMLEAQQI